MKMRSVLLCFLTVFGALFFYEGHDRITNLTLAGRDITFASKVTIETPTKSKTHDALIMMNGAIELGGEIVSTAPLTFLMDKSRTMRFLDTAAESVELPEATKERVRDFLEPADELERILIEIKFIETD